MTDAERRAAERAQAVAERLDAIVEELDEVSFELLRECAAEGMTSRPQVDRTLTQARRAAARAAALLRGSPDD